VTVLLNQRASGAWRSTSGSQGFIFFLVCLDRSVLQCWYRDSLYLHYTKAVLEDKGKGLILTDLAHGWLSVSAPHNPPCWFWITCWGNSGTQLSEI